MLNKWPISVAIQTMNFLLACSRPNQGKESGLWLREKIIDKWLVLGYDLPIS